MCSMSLTVVVMPRSKTVRMRLSISGGRHAGVVPNHADDGDVDVGKDVNRHGDDRGYSKQQNGHGHHNEGIRAAER